MLLSRVDSISKSINNQTLLGHANRLIKVNLIRLYARPFGYIICYCKYLQ